MRKIQLIGIWLVALLCTWPEATRAQELNARVSINHQQIQGTSTNVFETLETALNEFINEKQWTNLQFQQHERIDCNFSITVTKYDEGDNRFDCTLMVQSTRPVYNSNYTTVVFSTQDTHFNFQFQEFDKLEFRPDVIDNDLTALVAYYAYLIIGMDLDAMAPKGGTEVLQLAKDVCSNAQNLVPSAKGWKAFEDSKNRYAIINDYLDNAMEPFRNLQYAYYREGLDTMAENVERGRAGITKAMGLLKEAHSNKSMSMLPQLFTEYKRDEIVNIYSGMGTPKDKEEISETLMKINASQASYWRKLKQ